MTRAAHLADYIPYLCAANRACDAFLTRVGGVARTAYVQGPDVETVSADDIADHHRRFAGAVARFGTGWSVTIDDWRIEAPEYLPESDFGGCYAAQEAEAARRRRFTEAGRMSFANSGFVTVHLKPPANRELLDFLWERSRPGAQALMQRFDEESMAFFAELANTMPVVEVQSEGLLASYLHSTVTFRQQPVSGWPEMWLAQAFASVEWWNDPDLSVDGRVIRTVEIINPTRPNPLTCDPLYRLAFPRRWTTTVHCLSAADQPREVEQVRKRWDMKRLRPGTALMRAFSKNYHSGRENPDAVRAVAELDHMRATLHEQPFGLCHSNIHVWADDAQTADDRASHVVALLRSAGVICRVATLNAFHAVMGDMPGNVSSELMNIRRSRWRIRTAIDVSPVRGVDRGDEEDGKLKGPPVLLAKTPLATPYGFAYHGATGEVGHTVFMGRTGGGKTIMMNSLSLSFLRYPDASVTILDKKRGSYVTTLCAGGKHVELAPGEPGVQPLRNIDDPSERTWAHGYLVSLLEHRHVVVDASVSKALEDALRALAGDPAEERTLTGLHAYLGHTAAREALDYFRADGPLGPLLDAVVPGFGTERWLCVETDQLDRLGATAPLVMVAVLHALDAERFRMPGPKKLSIDEAWSVFDEASPLARGIEALIRQARKYDLILEFATQTVGDMSREGLPRLIFSQVSNKFWLPDVSANNRLYREQYLAAGLTPVMVGRLTTMVPRRDYLVQNGNNVARPIITPMDGAELLICGAHRPLDQRRAAWLRARGTEPGEAFTRAWMSESTMEWMMRVERPVLTADEAELVAAE